MDYHSLVFQTNPTVSLRAPKSPASKEWKGMEGMWKWKDHLKNGPLEA
jgi:hypothetical protein